MSILVFNAGSSSLKFALYAPELQPILTGDAEGFGSDHSRLAARNADGSEAFSHDAPIADLQAAAQTVITTLRDKGTPEPDAIGHRIVHGGPDLHDHCRIDERVQRQLEKGAAFAPLHGPPALAVITIARHAYAGRPQIACLDTVFHRTMPKAARRFPLPPDFAAHGLYRYGFHGINCESVVQRLGAAIPARVVIAHLGGGASITAVHRGQSIDTSMGLTPTGGMMMATRCGDLDPGLLIYLARNGYDADRLEQLLDKQSGLAGVSGLGGDMRRLHEAADDPEVALAIAMFCASAAKTIAGMATSLRGIDLLVFTGGIGAHDQIVRDRIMESLGVLGSFRYETMPAEEEKIIAQHTARLARI